MSSLWPYLTTSDQLPDLRRLHSPVYAVTICPPLLQYQIPVLQPPHRDHCLSLSYLLWCLAQDIASLPPGNSCVYFLSTAAPLPVTPPITSSPLTDMGLCVLGSDTYQGPTGETPAMLIKNRASSVAATYESKVVSLGVRADWSE